MATELRQRKKEEESATAFDDEVTLIFKVAIIFACRAHLYYS